MSSSPNPCKSSGCSPLTCKVLYLSHSIFLTKTIPPFYSLTLDSSGSYQTSSSFPSLNCLLWLMITTHLDSNQSFETVQNVITVMMTARTTYNHEGFVRINSLFPSRDLMMKLWNLSVHPDRERITLKTKELPIEMRDILNSNFNISLWK